MNSLGVTLAATIHDPEARSCDAIRSLGDELRSLFDGLALNISSSTAPEVVRAADNLAAVSIITHPANPDLIGRARRDSLALAVESGASHIFYSDFDHLLRWLRRFPGEVRTTLSAQAEVDILVVGRSASSLAMEPQRLRSTEDIVNHIYSLITGRRWDLMFAMRRFSHAAARAIVNESSADTIANDVEWPLLAEKLGFTLGYAEADALYYRTMAEFDSERDSGDGDPVEWIKRVEIAADHARKMRAYIKVGQSLGEDRA